jgi:hypothetical protein
VLGDDSEAARIVAETGAGFATSGSDSNLIASALERLVASPSEHPRDRAAVEPYSYPYVARRYAALIEDVVSRGSEADPRRAADPHTPPSTWPARPTGSRGPSGSSA